METRAPLSMPSDFLASEHGGRPREVFRHLVEAYLTSGEPVGSRTLSQRLPLTLSPASIRNVMADLERMGLLYAPHTSAGRVRTARCRAPRSRYVRHSPTVLSRCENR